MLETRLVEFDASAYSLLAVQKACYRFTNQASFNVQAVMSDGPGSIQVTLQPLKPMSDKVLTRLVQQLHNEALDQQLREQIRIQTEGVRNLILAHAFSKTGLIAPDGAAPAV
ncbi:His-Xaa-Ser system protein HxsD [Uliginosibacterium sp. TH139]|uniref:His-Xaa-Ser system protein HxsD n=1 Tax=Uliginosibacterium sp. TH139 TaxID=2067453 RepID=UPI0013044635|nr:His-Xaa-Ser system protein HxsD [Uliginosibacterium sp. TH139]